MAADPRAGNEPASGADLGADHATLVFDGTCVLCNGWVDALIARDRDARYRFAAMQAPAGRRLALAHGLDPEAPVSLLLLDHDGPHLDSEAIIRVLTGLGGVWRLVALARAMPRGWRDRVYRAFARRRYRWFGRRQACRLPAPAERHRFLVD
ncbi:thiol-disulfide oxidoreductase DCC family protein [Luteimonas abyssi]|uniref:thiol-disulfide oxidoreductase DCC family protein n=1 Tax=Luteimonas abyssi TaxID=1247514 RepID=UPI000737B243|nr:DCC1-like thiol-disulfide oxidoreductase family protein [Luteimonas abyssi]